MWRLACLTCRRSCVRSPEDPHNWCLLGAACCSSSSSKKLWKYFWTFWDIILCIQQTAFFNCSCYLWFLLFVVRYYFHAAPLGTEMSLRHPFDPRPHIFNAIDTPPPPQGGRPTIWESLPYIVRSRIWEKSNVQVLLRLFEVAQDHSLTSGLFKYKPSIKESSCRVHSQQSPVDSHSLSKKCEQYIMHEAQDAITGYV